MATKQRKPYMPGLVESQVMEGVREALACFGLAEDVDRQNTGAARNPAGRLVMFGRKGDSDWSGMIPANWGSASGKRLDIECKREGFDPAKLKPGSRDRAHFDRQLARLKRTCANGGYGLWINDARQVVHALTRIREGWRVVFEGDYPILTDELEG